MREADWQRAVIDLAHLFDWHVAHFRPARTVHGWRTPVAADGAGFPDLVAVHPDHGIVFAELKSDTGRLSAQQAAWLDLLASAGGTVHVWRPADANTVATKLSHGRITEWAVTRP